MHKKYENLNEKIIDDFMKVYQDHLNNVNDDFEYYTLITAVLTFKEIVLNEVKENIFRESEESPDVICKMIETKATEIAGSIKTNSLKQN